MGNKKLTLFQGGIIFSVTEILFLIFSFLNIFDNYFISGTVGEIGIILLPAVIFVLVFKKDIKENFRIRKVGAVNSIIIVITMWFTIPVTLSASYISIIVVNMIFKNNIMADVPMPNNLLQFLLSVLVIGVFAAVCEEALFRGVLMSAAEKLGVRGSFILISVIFALFHFNLEKAAGVFLLSLVICYIVYRTNSVFAGMIAHFTNNATAVLISYIAMKMIPNALDSEQSVSDILNQSPGVMIFSVFILLFIALVSGAVVVSLLYLLKTRTEKTKMIFEEKTKIRLKDFVTFLPGFIIMFGMYIYLIFQYIAG
ncbi:MAG: CPBP family intramembrane metalloprotease [Clostridia bacterium]|nr:CPBP family intramembrane metalloprotease [Clostridia bacterium]